MLFHLHVSMESVNVTQSDFPFLMLHHVQATPFEHWTLHRRLCSSALLTVKVGGGPRHVPW